MILEQAQLRNELVDLFGWQTNPVSGSSDLFIDCSGDERHYCPSIRFVQGEWQTYWPRRVNELGLVYEHEKTDCDDFAETCRTEALTCHRLNNSRGSGLAWFVASVQIIGKALGGISPSRHMTNLIRVSDKSDKALENWLFYEPQTQIITTVRSVAGLHLVRLLNVRL